MVNSFIFTFSIILFTSGFAFASCPAEEQNNILVFSNGMFNDRSDARASLDYLRNTLGHKYKGYKVAYNFNETPLLQLLEVFEHKVKSEKRFLWSYFSKFRGPQWFSELMAKKAAAVSSSEYVRDEDLRKHIAIYKEHLELGYGTLTVAHSQGNFYANRSFEILASTQAKIVNQFRIVGVAVPDGNLSGTVDYRTLESDFVIRPIPHAPPFNVSNIKHGYFDHSFIEHYLKGSPSGSQITDIVQSATRNLKSTDYYFEAGYLHSSLEPMNKWLWRFSKSPSKYKLSTAQCLAVSLFLKMENYFGETCEKRDIVLIRKIGQGCLNNEWRNPDQLHYDCQLIGLPNQFLSLNKSPVSELSLLSGQANCVWRHATVHKDLTEDVLESAFHFIENPK